MCPGKATQDSQVLEPRTVLGPGAVVQYVGPSSKAWCFYDPASRRAVVSRDAVFNEPASWTWEDEDMGAAADFVIEYRMMDLGSDQFGADLAPG
ncbi:hypothetical protein E2562_015448 [Oryza meyeriana var. granulata]|uniref:Retroviral polymerase SH3-like domain-containing protein n=1 Tax=Oryza meyeriana var. granulata TaxID=110450 RepID=A0A6G1BX41_9ORYZ|nr:hypothetical protein E2562_015448 [Oryza meyeriana var. granulata]